LAGMPRQIDAVFFNLAALLVSAGLFVAAVPAARTEAAPAPAPLTVDFGCPYAELVIVSESADER
jgi:hypothetical protein